MLRRWIVLGLVLLVLASCGSEPTAAPGATTTGAQPATTVQASATTEPAATAIPEPSPTTEAVPLTAERVIEAFKAAGLEAENPTPMGKDDYGVGPMVGEGMRFFLPSLAEGAGGRVIAVDDADERKRLFDYYNDLKKQSAALFSWVYEHENIVLQINGKLPEDQAKKYEEALKNAR
jgi:hypothetical protein